MPFQIFIFALAGKINQQLSHKAKILRTYVLDEDFYCRDHVLLFNFAKAAVNTDVFYQFIGFCIWDGHDQENASNWASNNAKLIFRVYRTIYGIKWILVLMLKLEICC